MAQIKRFGVSLEEDLLEAFDAFLERGGYPNRSEGIRDLIREALRGEEVAHGPGLQVGALVFLYDHHRPGLLQKITRTFHDEATHTTASLHVHVTHTLCLEVALLKGKAQALRNLASRIRAMKGVLLGDLFLAPVKEP